MFGFGKNKFLGVDVGASSIKIVELEIRNGKPFLANYAWADFGAKGLNRGVNSLISSDVLPEYIKKIYKEGKFKSKNAYISIPSTGGLIVLVEFPEMSDEDLAQAIKFEAHKYVPASLDDVALSWDVINKKTKERKIFNTASPKTVNGKEKEESSKMQVLLIAAPKNKIANYEKMAKKSALSLKTIEIESFSLVRSLVGNDQRNLAVMDIGSKVCNIILVEKGIIKASRSIEAGGKELTEAIAHSMNIDEARAEKIKISGKKLLNNPESPISFPILDRIVSEARRVFSSYYKEQNEIKIDQIILTGGSSGLIGLIEYFFHNLNIPVSLGNPMGRVEYNKSVEDKLNQMKNRFSVAIGLALSGVEEKIKK
ncbi:MAG: hypothetical protein COU40_00140 [Candidatus Moranbacteria bacterium CG10_big_fil_rev_8_21_14_0_10_35_21]|nr:MAG: hypothetical protein COU40_00140 [Candidatus Moranbacteria bacterium CG10_big_fil_rev_8_21_14_0_10_35_21]